MFNLSVCLFVCLPKYYVKIYYKDQVKGQNQNLSVEEKQRSARAVEFMFYDPLPPSLLLYNYLYIPCSLSVLRYLCMCLRSLSKGPFSGSVGRSPA